MSGLHRLRAALGTSVAGAASPLAAADQLCQACVQLLGVDGASISLIHQGSTRGTFGSSGEMSRRLDELQFTLGEGPCLDAVSTGRPVLVPDLTSAAGQERWPAFAGAVLEAGVTAVFALPVLIAREQAGALDLFRAESGSLTEEAMDGASLAAELAALPLLDLMSSDVDWDRVAQGGDGWEQLASLERVEVYQATGMVMGALDVGPSEALVRLRGYAFAHGMTASEVAWQVVERQLLPRPDGWGPGADLSGSTS